MRNLKFSLRAGVAPVVLGLAMFSTPAVAQNSDAPVQSSADEETGESIDVTDSLIQRIAVSLHGVTVFVLCVGAVLIGMIGFPRQELGATFQLLLFVPLGLVAYSIRHFHGKRAIHLLQAINLLWLAFASFLGRMAVTGVWL